jgi:hypothetical protein
MMHMNTGWMGSQSWLWWGICVLAVILLAGWILRLVRK